MRWGLRYPAHEGARQWPQLTIARAGDVGLMITLHLTLWSLDERTKQAL
jgi:hypothetical protein